MLAGVTIALGRLPRNFAGFPGAWLFVFVVIALIALLFMRMYGGGGR